MRSVVVSIASLPPEGDTYTLRIAPDEVNEYLAEVGLTGVRAVGEATSEARLMRSGSELFVLGTLRTRIRYECARCLSPFEEAIDAPFHLACVPESEDTAGEVELRKEDLDLQSLEAGTVDLYRTVLEQLDLALKPYPICEEKCLGLCPQCGANKNLGPCGCTERMTDPRFRILEKWSGGSGTARK